MLRRNWSVEKAVQQAREALANENFQAFTQCDPEAFEKELSKGVDAEAVNLAVHLTYPARGYRVRGAVAVMDGDASGWSQIMTGWTLDAWFQALVLNNLYAGKYTMPSQFIDSWRMHVVAEAILFRRYNFARGLINHYRDLYDRDLSDWDSSYWQFLLHLGAVWQGQPRPEPRGKVGLGPFENVFTHWDEPDKLEPVINDIHEWHVVKSLKDQYPNDFEMAPYSFWPIHVLALREVRATMKLETPLGTHPLGLTPLCIVPPQIMPTPDPFLDKALPIFQQAARYIESDWEGLPRVVQGLPERERISNAQPRDRSAQKPVTTRKRRLPTGLSDTALQNVLALCGVPNEDAGKFDALADEDTPWDHAVIEGLSEAEQVLIVDWRDEWSGPLEQISEIAARFQWPIELDDEAEDRVVLTLQDTGDYVWMRREEDDFGALVKSLCTLTDKLEALSLKGMDGRESDTWSFVLLPPETWVKVRAELGEKHFKKIFVPLRSSTRKWKSLSPK